MTTVSIESSCELIVDCPHSTPTWTEHGVLVFRNQNIRGGRLDLAEPSFTSETEYSQRIMRATPSAGDIIITREAPIGEVAIIPEGVRGCLGQRMVLLRPNKHIIIPPFMLYSLMSSEVQREMIVRAGTGSTVANLRIPVLKSIELRCPPLHEQQAIAAALSDVDALIVSLDQLLGKKRDMKQAAMQELLTGKRRLPGFSGEWVAKKLGEVADIDPENLRNDTSPDYSFCYISLEDVDAGKLTGYTEQVFRTAPSRARRRIRKGDVLVSTVRPNLKSHLLIRREIHNFVCSTGFSVARCNPSVSLPEYIFFHFFAGNIERQIEALLTGSNYPAINSSDVRGLLIPLPPLPEQTAIAAILSDMDAEITALEQKLDKTRLLKQGMMQELLTGRIRLV